MAVTINGTTGVAGVDGSASTPAVQGGDTNTGVFFPAADTAAISTNGTERMRIDSSGNVGIGTSSPTQKLTIADSTSANFLMVGAGTNYITYAYSGFAVSGTASNTPWLFYTNNTERARIDSSGTFAVGGTQAIRPGDQMAVEGTGAQVVTFRNNTNASGYSAISTIILSNGNNTSTYHFWGNTSAVGNWYLYGNGTTSYSSDERLKKNIVTTRDGYIDDLMKLRVVKYNWKKDDDGTPKELGLIAQEVEQVFPGLVQDDLNPVEEGGEIFKQLKQSVLPFILLKAIQELKAEVDSLKAELATTKNA